jgi:hypothetical protein
MGDFSEKSNLTVVFKDDPDSDDEFGGTHVINYNDSTHKFTSEHMIILSHMPDNSIEGQVFPIKAIKSFRWQ